VHQPCTCTPGRLAPRADPVTGALEWHVTTPSRELAALIAEASGGTISAHDKYQVRIPQPILTSTILSADAEALQCTVTIHPHPGLFILAFAPWPANTVIKYPLASLPADGILSVRDLRVKTRMGRIVRYLVPEFRPP
jgi:hypothetical protein